MMLRKDNWSHWEHELITEVILEFAKQKKSIGEAFQHLEIMIPDRTKNAISSQWYAVLRKKIVKPPVEETKETSLASNAPLELDQYVKLLESSNLTMETIELINMRIRSLI